MSEAGSKLGLSPQARSTIKVPDKKPEKDNTADFLFGDSGRTKHA
jgi:phage terminase small subunit